jgi:hypothetical protein
MTQESASQFRFFEPIIHVLRAVGGAAPAGDVIERVIDLLAIDELQLAALTKSGKPKVEIDIRWARKSLVEAGLLDGSERGMWTLTDVGWSQPLGVRDGATGYDTFVTPSVRRFFLPIISALRQLGGAAGPQEVVELALGIAGVDERERSEVTPGGAPRVNNQVHWARQWLVWAGLLDGSHRGRWLLTPAGSSCAIEPSVQTFAPRPSEAVPPPVTRQGPRIWVIRAGAGAAYAARFLSDGVVAIGFDGVESAEGLSFEEISARMKAVVVDEAPVAVGLAAGAVYRIASAIEEGDFVVTPEGEGWFLAGEVAGPYEYKVPPFVENYSHLRPVRWFARVHRSELSEQARRSLRPILTLFLPGHQQDVLDTIAPLSDHPVPVPKVPRAKSSRHDAVLVVIDVPEDAALPQIASGSKFETDKVDVLFLLEQIRNAELALPDFQRSFVWDPSATKELIVSIIRSFPAGNLLFLRGGSHVFVPREVESAPSLNGRKPSALILDGQQRLSSLFQAFAGLGTHRFFVDIAVLMRGDDLDAAVKVYSAARARPWGTTEGQATSLMFPLSRVNTFSSWRDEILDWREQRTALTVKPLRSYLNAFEEAVVAPIRSYQFPVTRLDEATPTEAVCTIFETLNRTGVKLSVFELICARAFAEGHRLREAWKEALSTDPILGDFDIDPYYLLQAIALRDGQKPQRGVVAGLEVTTIVNGWDAAVRGMARGIEMLRDECGVLTPKLLPYAPMLPTLAAAWRDVEEATGAAIGARKLKLQRWFWCACFVGDYDNAPNSRAEADVPLLHAWLSGGEVPAVVTGFDFAAESLSAVTARQRGLYRATMALLMRNRPRDFHQASTLTRAVIESSGVDDHHVFPAAYLKASGVSRLDTVLNHTLIDKITNIRIGKRPPSVYLAEVESELGPAVLAEVLDSHLLPYEKEGPLWNDDYDAFLAWRAVRLADALGAVTEDAT